MRRDQAVKRASIRRRDCLFVVSACLLDPLSFCFFSMLSVRMIGKVLYVCDKANHRIVTVMCTHSCTSFGLWLSRGLVQVSIEDGKTALFAGASSGATVR